MTDEQSHRYEYCLVGNIIGAHYSIARNAVLYGSKHFRPGAKVYVALIYCGMGNESVQVFGKPRRQWRMIDLGLRASYITNWRVQKVYDPKVLEWLDRHYSRNYGYTTAEEFERLVKSMRKRATKALDKQFRRLGGGPYRVLSRYEYRPPRLPAPLVLPPWGR